MSRMQLKVSFSVKSNWFEFKNLPSRLVAIPRLKSPVYSTIELEGE